MNQETKITLRFYSILDIIYVFSMFKLSGKINYINNLSYFACFLTCSSFYESVV